VLVNAQDVPSQSRSVFFMLCPSCGDGSVRVKSGAIYPAPIAGAAVRDLPDDVAAAWQDARTCYAVAAYTPSEMMCRKILMHVAVDKAGIAAGLKYWEYVAELEKGGYFMTGHKPIIDKIRDRGNAANHELPSTTEEQAKTTLAITEYLLRGIYELPNL
jgi:hypothetical protein